jgi:tetratricopeptide (TPR) repeat protein
LRLEYRFTQNQVFEFRLSLLDQPEKETTYEVENPLTHVLNPHSVRLEIEELEEQMREREIPENQMPTRAVELAEKYAKLGQDEKAISLLEKALLMLGRADERILTLLGIYCGRIGNHPREVKFYREAARCGNWNGPLFNLALSQKQRGEFQAALKTIEEMEGRPMDGPELTLKTMIRDGLNISDGREELISRALAKYPPVHAQSEWQFDWYRAAASLKRDPQLDSLIAKEKQRRLQAGEQLPPQGELPMVTASPALRP